MVKGISRGYKIGTGPSKSDFGFDTPGLRARKGEFGFESPSFGQAFCVVM